MVTYKVTKMDIGAGLGQIWSLVKKYVAPLVAGYIGYSVGPWIDVGAILGDMIGDKVPDGLADSVDVGYGLSALLWGFGGWTLFKKGGFIMKMVGAFFLGWAASDAMTAFGVEAVVE